MCRYGFSVYKSHFACFNCRKSFKKTALPDYLEHQGLREIYFAISSAYSRPKKRKQLEERFGMTCQQIKAQYLADVSVCPQCAGKMAAMGLDFRAPAQTALEAWQIIEKLYEYGFAFHGCGCSVGYVPPAKLRDLPEWLESHRYNDSKGKKLLEAILAKRA